MYLNSQNKKKSFLLCHNDERNNSSGHSFFCVLYNYKTVIIFKMLFTNILKSLIEDFFPTNCHIVIFSAKKNKNTRKKVEKKNVLFENHDRVKLIYRT